MEFLSWQDSLVYDKEGETFEVIGHDEIAGKIELKQIGTGYCFVISEEKFHELYERG